MLMGDAKRLLYGTDSSGHTHRVVLMLALLGLEYEFISVPRDQRDTPEFKQLNPLRQIPVLVDGEVVLADSNAILVYLAKRYGQHTAWLPEDSVGAARVQRWLSIAAGEIAYGPARARVITHWMPHEDKSHALQVANKVLGFMEEFLLSQSFLAADHATIADIACYAYIAHAPEGGIDLGLYPSIRLWLARVEAVPGFVPMKRLPHP